MNAITKKHFQINAARRVKESLDYINSSLSILQDKTPEEAYLIVSSAFRTHAFDAQDWENLKESKELLPKMFKEETNIPYKASIKKISDEMHQKANPEYEKKQAQKKEEEKEKSKDTQNDYKRPEESIFEQEEDEPSRTLSNDANTSRNVNFGKSNISFNIVMDVRTEKQVLDLVRENNIPEALDLLGGLIDEQLQGQLSANDLVKARTPGDFKLSKPIGFSSAGITKTIQIRNKSLIETMSEVHLGLIVMKAKYREKQKQSQKKMLENHKEFGKALEEEILETDKLALEKLLAERILENGQAEFSTSEVEGALAPICESIKAIDKQKLQEQEEAEKKSEQQQLKEEAQLSEEELAELEMQQALGRRL